MLKQCRDAECCLPKRQSGETLPKATGSRPQFLAALLTTTALFTGLPAGAALADITVTDARIETGLLHIAGTSPTGTAIQMVGFKPNAPILAGHFSFDVLFRPANCVARLKVIGATAPVKEVLVANCGPGVIPRGAWRSTSVYMLDDLVGYDGSTWRALKTIPAGTGS